MGAQRKESTGSSPPKESGESIDFGALLAPTPKPRGVATGVHPAVPPPLKKPSSIPPPLPPAALSTTSPTWRPTKANEPRGGAITWIAICIGMMGLGAGAAALTGSPAEASETPPTARARTELVAPPEMSAGNHANVDSPSPLPDPVVMPEVAPTPVEPAPVDVQPAPTPAREAPQETGINQRTPVATRTPATPRAPRTPAPTPVATAPEQPEPQAEEASPWEEATPTQPEAPTNLPEQPSRDDVRTALESVAGAVRQCGDGTTHGTASVRVTVGSSGRVRNALVGGDFDGTPIGSCIARAVRGASFPQFSAESFTVQYPFTL